ncbi:hypothetical protein [Flavobacterium beibuense]|uniref:hypothetical protein n=1 Tax=Flavobacterium beibuense TaxID=657326 RepID=UPI003A8C8D10
MRNVTHKTIMSLHEDIAEQHKDIKGFFRLNWNEILNSMRSGVEAPVLAIESYSSELSGNKISNFNYRAISFMILDYAGKPDDYALQEEVLDKLEGVGLDISSYLTKLSKDRSHWLYGLYDINSFKMEKVGPVFDNMFGWNILYTIKSHEPMCFDETKWELP